jgi:hypothetical protein
MKNNIDMTDLNNRLEMFFFNPKEIHAKYREKYQQLYDIKHIKKYGIRFSPLYLLREDIFFCLGKSLGKKKIKFNFGPANFAGVILINTAINNIVNKLFNKDFVKFGTEYLEINEEWKINKIWHLRNTLIHNNYGLSYRCDKCSSKIYFKLDTNLKDLIKIDKKWQRNYPSELYIINPKRLHEIFENALKKVEKEINNNKKLQKIFMNNIRLKDWLIL